MLPTITGEFRVVGEPELKFTPSGKAVASIRAVASRSKKNEATGEWEDQGTIWVNVEAWEAEAEALAETVRDKDKVLVTGQIEVREYEKRDGSKGQSVDVKFAKVAVLPKTNSTPTRIATPSAPASDPWASVQKRDEPPF